MVWKDGGRSKDGCIKVKKMIIYKMHNCITGKDYIGQTTRSLEERTAEHIRHNEIVVDKAISKYGIDNFIVEEIDSASTIEELNEKEIYWIKKYNSLVPNGYNQCIGGDNTCGFHHREESKRKMSETKSQIYVGEGNPFYNKTHSEESRKKMSDKRKGMKHLSEEQVARLRESHRMVSVKNIETGEIFQSIKECAEKYHIPATHIVRVCKGKRKTAGGYHWQYIDKKEP